MFARLRNLFKPETKSSLAAPADWLLSLFGAAPTISGAAVSAQTATRVPAVAAAVNLISNAVGTLPAKLFARTDGAKQPDPSHPSYRLVHDDCNPWTSAGEFRRQITADALLNDHGGFAVAVRVNGRVQELHRLDPGGVRIDQANDGSPIYRVALKSGGEAVHGYTDVLQIKAPNGSPVTNAREAIGLALVLEAHAARLFANGGRPSGVLKFPNVLSQEAAARIKTSWQAAHGGAASGGTAVLESGGDFTPLAFTSVDSQFAEMRAFQTVEIARAFNVPVSMIGDLSRATWSNSEQMNLQFLQMTLLPWLRIWEAAYRRVLLVDNERDSYSIEFIVDDLLRADTATRANAYAQFRSNGIMTANELRKLENLPPLPGGDVLESPHVQSGGGQ